MNIHAMIEAEQRNLTRREKALKDTLEAIEIAEKAGATNAIKALRIKRDRQHNAVEATKETITALQTQTKPKK